MKHALKNWLAAALLTAFGISVLAQTAPPAGNSSQSTDPAGQSQTAQPPTSQSPTAQSPTKDTRITPAQAKELFQSVTEILTFASEDSKLPIRHEVKRRLITRAQVEKYVEDGFRKDKDAQHMQREEIVLKKFGLLDRDFALQPFLVSLLKEQIAGFYDNKTKTVNLLDWVAPDDQKPVMAHELTHALQDQHTDLDKWEPTTPNTVSKNVAEDNARLATDEQDTARDAVLEGQAMAVYIDYGLKPTGRSLLTTPDVGDALDGGADTESSPVMARAPLLLQEELLFPYRDGLQFEQTLLKDKGVEYAFAGVLDRPPSTSFEIMNPRAYERKVPIPLLHMPDVHGLLDGQYEPYDVGVMGELDVRVLSELFGGQRIAAELASQWNGGLYYAVKNRTPKTPDANTPDEKGSTASIGLLYLSAWRTEEAADAFADMYSRELSKKYSGVTRDTASETSPDERIYTTSEGPVLIVRQGRQVLVSESFGLDLARKLQLLMFGAQKDDENQVTAHQQVPTEDLTAPLGHLLAQYGMMRAALRH
jgi:hypothetical protein